MRSSIFFFFQAEDGIRDLVRSRGLGDVYKRQLVGYPEYYKKFGFDNVPELIHEGVPPEVFLAMSFDGNIPQGTVTFHEGFKADGQQERAGDA